MTVRSRLLATAATSVFLFTSGLVAPAYAQDQDAIADDQAVLDVVTVTARKKEETAQSAPVALSVYTAESIEELGIQTIDDIARHTAGLSFSRAFGRTTERPVIRGAANILAGVQFGVESGTAYFIDGVYYSGDIQAVDINQIERVEVIKGPQSALYGRNTYAGAINFITRRPDDEFRAYGEAEIATHDQYGFYGRVSGPIVEGRLRAGISFRYWEYGGEWTNGPTGTTIGDEQTFSVLGVVDFEPTDTVLIQGRLGYANDDDGPRPFALVGSETNNCFPGYRSNAFYDPNHLAFLNPPFAGIFPDNFTDDNINQYFCGVLEAPEQPTQDLDGIPFVGVEREMVYGLVKADIGFGGGFNLAAQFGFRDQELTTGADSDHQPGSLFFVAISPFFSIPTSDAFLNNAAVDESFDWSAEVRIESPVDRRIRGMIGGFYYDFEEENFDFSFANDPANDFLGPLDDIDSIENKAFFARIEVDALENLELSAEIRVQSETKSLFIDGEFDDEVEFNDVIPRFVVNYQANDDVLLYASYAEGLKPGGLNGPDGAEVGFVEYFPEESKNVEVGIKSTLFGGRMTANVSAFYIDISRYQLTTPIAGGSGSTNVNSVATNQGDAEVKGFEVEIRAAVSANLTVGGTYAFTDAEFTSGCDAFQFTLTSGGFTMAPIDINDPSTFNQFAVPDPTDPSRPANDPAGLFTGAADCSIVGNSVPLTSKHQASFFASYDRPIANGLAFFATMDFTHESSKFVQVHNLAETGDANILSARLGIRGENWRIEIFGSNLTDNDTIPIATRWFDLFQGFAQISSTTTPGIDNSILGPRSFFTSYRKGRQFGAVASVEF